MGKWDEYIVTEKEDKWSGFKATTKPSTRIPHGVTRAFPQQSWYAQMAEEMISPENVGAMAGEALGFAFGGPPGMIAGGGLGGMTGRASEKATGMVLDYIDSFSQKGQRPSELDAMVLPETGEDWQGFAKELGWSGVSQAALSGLGLGIFRAAARGLKVGRQAVFGKMLPEARETMRTLGPWMKGKMLPLLPAEATQGWLLDVAHNVTEASILGGKKIADVYKISRKEAIERMITAISRQVGKGASPDVIGDMFINTVRGKMSARSAVTAPLWQQIDDIMGKGRVNIKPIKKFLETSKELIAETRGEYPADFMKFIKRAFAKEDELSWMAARKWKSHLGRMLRETEFTVGKDDETYRMLLKTQNKLQGALREATEEVGGDAPKLWGNINTIYAKMSREINSKFVRRLFSQAKDKPEIFTRRLFQKGNITEVRKAKELIGSQTEEWKLLKRFHIEDVITRATDKRGAFKGIDFKNIFKGKGSIGEDVVKEIYSPQEYKILSDIADAVAFVESRQGGGTGAVFIQLAQAGAIPSMIYGAARGNALALGSGAAIWVGPSVLASAFTNPTTAKIMILPIPQPPR
jgi:hypothetical protein